MDFAKLPDYMYIIILLISSPAVSSQGNDDTRREDTFGQGVVDAAVTLIVSSKIFTDDQDLLRRIACVESRYGMDPDTYGDSNYHGGIWRVDQRMFDDIQVSGSQALNIRNSLRITWPTVRWDDLRKPLHSALAARLVLDNKGGQTIPLASDIDGQADHWKRHYDSGNGTIKEFKDAVAECEQSEECETPALDIVYVMDGSSSIGQENFEMSKEFVANTIKTFNVGEQMSRIGVVQYSSGPRVRPEINLGEINDKEELVTAVRSIIYMGGGTSTGAAITYAVSNYFEKDGRNKSIPKVCIVITDGQSSDDVLTPANNARTPGGIALFAVGVGNGIDIDELNEIANDPDDNYRFEVVDFTVFDNIASLIAKRTCKEPGDLPIGTELVSESPPNNVIYQATTIPEHGMMTYKLQTTTGKTSVYLSTVVPNPSPAFHEWSMTTEENGYAQTFIDVSNRTATGRSKRQEQADSILTLYAAIVNIGNTTNEFAITADEGDTTIELPCDDQPCQHGGACVNQNVESYFCQCAELYIGQNCEIDRPRTEPSFAPPTTLQDLSVKDASVAFVANWIVTTTSVAVVMILLI